uniref:Uncharacterized protein n=1 Tax=Knipowitschia caucasica TaxID=637954 RepID=A0AAV2L4V6_KNICA
MNNKDSSLYREMLQEIEDAKTGPAPPKHPACKIYSTQRSPDEPISGKRSILEDLPLVKGDDIKRLLTSFWENLQAEDVSEQKAKAKMEDMFKELICVSANEVLGALVTWKSLYECSPEFIALDRVIKLLCTEVALTVNSVLKDNCGFERVLLVEEKDYSTPRRTLRHIAANAPMFLPHMTFSDQWEKLLEAEISKGLTENELKRGVLDCLRTGESDV